MEYIGEIIEFEGKGMPIENTDSYGKLYMKIAVKFPTTISENDKQSEYTVIYICVNFQVLSNISVNSAVQQLLAVN